jgi:hypothetical protein
MIKFKRGCKMMLEYFWVHFLLSQNILLTKQTHIYVCEREYGQREGGHKY